MKGITEARVVRKDEQRIFVDIGDQTERPISRNEFDLPFDTGEVVEVYWDPREDSDHPPVLSRAKVAKIRRFERVEEVHEQDEVIEGRVIGEVRGGLTVKLSNGSKAFLPNSEIDVFAVRNSRFYIGKQMDLKVVQINRDIQNAVVSHRAIYQKELDEEREEVLSTLQVGQVREGIVKHMTDYGAFISLGGADGLLHNKNIAWGRVQHPSEVLSLDQVIEVVVVEYDAESQQIELSLKALTPDPWENIEEKYCEGDVVKGLVVAIADYGFFLELEEGVDGLVHISEISWTRTITDMAEEVTLAEQVEARVIEVRADERNIALSTKQLTPDPWDDIAEMYQAGDIVEGPVVSVMHYGFFVELGCGIDGLVHTSEMSWTRTIEDPSTEVTLGERVEVMVLDVDPEKQKVTLGTKQLTPNPWDDIAERYPDGTVLRAPVSEVVHFGAFVEVELGIDGLVHVSELSWTRREQRPPERIAEGDEMEVVVLDINPEQRRILLSHKQTQDNPWERLQEIYAAGTQTTGTVRRMEEGGLVVELPEKVEAVVPYEQLAGASEDYAEGASLALRVSRCIPSEQEIVLTERAGR